MTKFNKTLLASALALGATSALATPYFGPDENTIYFTSLENQYRSDAMCAAIGGCLADDPANDPAGYNMVDPTLTIATGIPVATGDIFAGVITVQNIQNSSATDWLQSTTDQFTGYFAQEVMAITEISKDVCEVAGLPPCGIMVPYTNIELGNPAVDPFGILVDGGMFRLFSDTGGTATTFDLATGGTTWDVIGLATDGAYWGTLGLGGEDVGYAYTIDNPALPGTSTGAENFTGLYLLDDGPAYSAGELDLVNDPNESEVGGVTTAKVCTAAEVADPNIICAQFAGTAEIESNSSSTYFGGSSPFVFLGNDPLIMSKVPEPASLALLGLGLVGLAGLRRRRA